MMSASGIIGKPLVPDLCLSGSRVVMSDHIPTYKCASLRRSSIESTGALTPRGNSLRDIHTCSTVNTQLFPTAAQHQASSNGLIQGGYQQDVSTVHRVHLRNIPKSIAPLTENDVANAASETRTIPAEEAQIIRKALNLERFKHIRRTSIEKIPNSNTVLGSETSSFTPTNRYNSQVVDTSRVEPHAPANSSTSFRNKSSRESTPNLPSSRNSIRSMPTPPLLADINLLLRENGANILRTQSSAIESVTSSEKSREASMVSEGKRSLDTDAVPVQETPTQKGSAKSKKKRKKKKRQGNKSASKARVKSALGRVPAATRYETSPLQAFCKPIAVISNKPEKPRIKYNPAMTGGWAPSVSAGSPYVTQGKTPMAPNTSHNLTPSSDLRISARKSVDNGAPRKSVDNGAPRKSFNNISKDFDRSPMQKLIKVFLSEKQSGVLKELGMEFPCAPPATPIPAVLEKYEYVPSMNDCRAQRAFKVRLEALDRVEKKKNEKIKEEKLKQDKIHEKEKERAWRRRQRLEIYALNKVMTDFEYGNFQEFCKKNGLNTS